MNRTSIDIEFGHHQLEPRAEDVALELTEIDRSAELAAELRRRLRRRGLSVSMTLLVDDKHHERTHDIDAHLRSIEERLPKIEIDRVLLETSLGSTLSEFLGAIDDGKREHVKQEIEGWARRRGTLACSQDIALWQSLRLGMYSPVGDPWYRRRTDNVGGVVSGASVVVSVLPRRFESQEARAWSDILQYVSGIQAGRIQRIFFSPEDTTASLSTALDAAADACVEVIRAAKGQRPAESRQYPRVVGDSISTPPTSKSSAGASSSPGHGRQVGLIETADLTDAGIVSGLRVTVVGAGVAGLSTALTLAKAGAQVAVVSSPQAKAVSPVACALWLPTWVASTDAMLEEDPRLRKLLEPSWNEYHSLLEAHGASIGLRSVEHREYLPENDDPPVWLQQLLPNSRITLNELVWEDRRYDRLWTCETIVIDMGRYLRWLRASVEAAGVSLSERHLASLTEVTEDVDVVINCSGLGARRLVDDEGVRPVRGQLLFYECVDEKQHPSLVSVGLGEYCFIPRIDDIGLGSLLRDEPPDSTEALYSLEDEATLLSVFETLGVLGDVDLDDLRACGRRAVGLRPLREGGFRLESETLDGGQLVVHNYGHGGGGVTFAWGCAEHVRHLVSEHLAA